MRIDPHLKLEHIGECSTTSFSQTAPGEATNRHQRIVGVHIEPKVFGFDSIENRLSTNIFDVGGLIGQHHPIENPVDPRRSTIRCIESNPSLAVRK